MKKGLLAVLFTAVLIFTGCSKKNSPETAAKEFISSFINGDTNAFKQYSTDSTKELFTLAMAMKCSQEEMNNDMPKCLKKIGENLKSVEVVGVKKNGKEALVTLKETLANGKVTNESIPVVETKDGWKVNIKK
ncbi:hypothetical protein C3L23_00960 [Nautilia sp. PV-1]|uniref:DUF4878 domain-containing protein n=1 Tax=Nautilia sp. PV-1 TaxID=2579250 RepID=UPI000FDB4DFA|nr:DUF4878 domain-containing protein [Nautilia sp. PV-1]AZV45885.1 hypothetical protein C3L23_00960 [Nautilia sp. PV-1]